MARPYGVSLLIGGIDETGPSLYESDPSGTMIRYDAKGMGAAEDGILSLLKEKYKKELSLAEGEKLALHILKQVMQDKITSENC